MSVEAHELFYCEDSNDYNNLMASLKAQWPNAVFEDGSDDIHEYRFSVTIADVEQDDLYRFALKNGCALSGFGFNLAMYEDTKHISTLVNEWKAAQ